MLQHIPVRLRRRLGLPDLLVAYIVVMVCVGAGIYLSAANRHFGSWTPLNDNGTDTVNMFRTHPVLRVDDHTAGRSLYVVCRRTGALAVALGPRSAEFPAHWANTFANDDGAAVHAVPDELKQRWRHAIHADTLIAHRPEAILRTLASGVTVAFRTDRSLGAFRTAHRNDAKRLDELQRHCEHS